MSIQQKSSKGFTIVELLIVIVVIGILAAITVVAYNGFQQRARNTQVIAGTNAYYKALLLYKAANSSYPPNSSCLGANYPYGEQCWKDAAGVSSVFDNALAPFIGNTKPTLATEFLSLGDGTSYRAGAVYWYDSASQQRVMYYLAGTNQNCSISGAIAYNINNVVTECYIYMPN